MVLLGTPNAESSRLYAMTVTEGDPPGLAPWRVWRWGYLCTMSWKKP